MILRSVPFQPYLLFLGLFFCHCIPLEAQNSYEERVETFLNTAKDANGYDALVVRASMAMPLNLDTLHVLLDEAMSKAEADFRLTRLIRILFLTDGEYDELIVPIIEELPYWLPDPENLRQYWSENHMIMWMSADWLMHEKYNKPIRPTLRQNLIHWLNLKLEYGFYEYFSSIYFPFTTAGLLNLVDFAEDEELATLAEQVVNKLLKDVLLVVNDKGVFYPTAGRNEVSQYIAPYESNIQKAIYLLTGLGEVPPKPGIATAALATSNIDVSQIINSWSAEVNQRYSCGHSLSEADNIHRELSKEDKIIFNWSAGAYVHPMAANNTLWQIQNYNMWEHEEFHPYSFAQILPESIGEFFGTLTASFSRSSYIGQAEIEIYKDQGVVLTSSQSQWEGRLGYQIWPIAATVETECVFIRSGEVMDWTLVPKRKSNEHLPYVEQEDNVALIMFRQNVDLTFWGHDQTDVALYFQEDQFEEVRTFDNWILGRIDNSYVAVKKHCDEVINGIQGCSETDGQTWAIVVGNEDSHQSFDNFESIIAAATYEERWYFDWEKFRWFYYGHINVDNKDIEHHWEGHWLDGPNNENGKADKLDQATLQEETNNFSIYPNPAKDKITLHSNNDEQMIESYAIYNLTGQKVLNQIVHQQNSQLDVSQLQNGVYTLTIENEQQELEVKRLVIER